MSPNSYPFFSFITLLTVLYLFRNTRSFVFNNFETREILGGVSTITAESNIWNMKVMDGLAQKYTTCGSYLYLGGYGILKPTGEFSYRGYYTLPTHTMIYFNVHFHFLDNWAPTDYFTISFDSNVIDIKNFASYSDFRYNACGLSRRGFEMRIQGKIPHTANYIIIGVASHLGADPTDRSFGFRELVLLYSNIRTETQELCGQADIPLLNNFACPCTLTQYKASDGSCKSCHADCINCFGGSSSECFQCSAGRYFNGTHCVVCDSTCWVCFKEGPYGCKYCTTPRFLIDDQCITDCDPPMATTLSPIRTCDYKCTNAEYLYSDETCQSSCPPPLTAYTKYNRKFCKSHCAAGEETFYDGSCLTSECVYPLVLKTYGSLKVCELPCGPGQIKFQDGACDSASLCVYPLFRQAYPRGEVCMGSCPNPSEFLYWDNICRPDCPSPFEQKIINTLKMCKIPFCGAQLCPVCQSRSDCSDSSYCKQTTGNGVCISYIAYKLQSTLVRTILNGYLIRVEVIPLQGIPENDNSYDRLILEISSLQENNDYAINIEKISKGTFLVTVTLLRSLEQDTLSLHFTYSPANLGLHSELTLPREVYISPGLQKAAEIAQTSSYVSFGIMMVSILGYVMSGGLSALWSFLPENQYSYYLIYLNIHYPYHTKLYFRSLSNFDLLLSPDPDDLANIDRETQRSLPRRFVEEDYSISFMENAGQTVAMLLAILLALMLVTLLFRVLSLPRRSYLAHKTLLIIRKILKWNGLVRQLLAYSLPLMLASFIQIHTSIFNTESFSFASSFAGILVAVITFGFSKTFHILKNIPSTSFERLVYSEWYGTLWQDLELDSNSKYYFWLTAIRGVILTYVCSFFEVFPHVQVTVMIICQLIIISLFFKNFKIQFIFESKALSLVMFGEEVLLLIMKLAIFAFLVLKKEYNSDDFDVTMGWIIIAPGIVNQMSQSIYAICAQIAERKKIIGKLKGLFQTKRQKKVRKFKLRQKTELMQIELQKTNEKDFQKNGTEMY